MCGIAGFCDFNKQSSPEILAQMTDTMIHRGPDSSGFKYQEDSAFEIGLGHRRLSILDLSELGSQPMSFEHLHIVLNGEIYNFKEIRKELEESGYSFASWSDTEVVLKAFHKWDVKAVDRFIGMFSFAIFDEKNRQIYLFRDRAGVKPLYYYFEKGLLLFGSELRSLIKHPLFKKEINISAVSQYFSLGYIPAPLSIYNHIYKLEQAHYLQLDLTQQKLSKHHYWSLIDQYNKPKIDASEDEILKHTESLLHSAFNYRMVADVPVGIFLSGGYDSATVAAIIQSSQQNKLNTFTIGFHEEQYNEAPFAKQIANHLGTNHHEHYCTPEDVKSILPLLGKMFDEPFGDSSAVPTYLVSKNARKSVTVALSADGGDEVFGGYSKYDSVLKYHPRFQRASPIARFATQLALKSAQGIKIESLLKNNYNLKTRIEKVLEMSQAKGIGESLYIVSEINTHKEVKDILKKSDLSQPWGFASDILINNGNDLLNTQMALDYITYMVDDILVKVDRTGMAVSLEGREPILDHRIIEFMAQVPSEYKIRNGEKKYLLKKIAHKYIPKELMDRPKKGFSFPVFEWLKDDLAHYMNIYLNEDLINKQGIFRWSEIKSLINSFKKGNYINSQKIWLLLSFQLWYHEWMD
jgi:asparagine synthase (glutamine-hydrolysing)